MQANYTLPHPQAKPSTARFSRSLLRCSGPSVELSDGSEPARTKMEIRGLLPATLIRKTSV
jgi:hypothetical protein